jgi:hypothetical protein
MAYERLFACLVPAATRTSTYVLYGGRIRGSPGREPYATGRIQCELLVTKDASVLSTRALVHFYSLSVIYENCCERFLRNPCWRPREATVPRLHYATTTLRTCDGRMHAEVHFSDIDDGAHHLRRRTMSPIDDSRAHAYIPFTASL